MKVYAAMTLPPDSATLPTPQKLHLRLTTPVIVRVDGADAEAFLQGQLSNDVTHLGADRAQLSSYNSPKGRMLAVLQLLRHDGAIHLLIEREVAEATVKRLRMFVLRSKVTLTDVSSLVAVHGLLGSAAAEALAQLKLPAPEDDWACVEAGEVSVIRQPGALPRYLLIGPEDRLGDAAEDAGQDWRLQQILAGVPTVYRDTSDHFVAQMANLDLLGGISFTKGCYTGQEIVARLHYLGQLKRRMFLCYGLGASPAPGSAVHEAGQTQAVGEVVDAATLPQGGFAAAVVLQLAHAESDRLQLGTEVPIGLSRPQAYAATEPG